MFDYINTNKFKDISDFKIDLLDKSIYELEGGEKFDPLDPYISFDMQIFKKSGIIYCRPQFLKELFFNLHFSGNKYVLITHYSDLRIDQITFNNRPACIKKWFAQNVSYKHTDLIPLPIGLVPLHFDVGPQLLKNNIEALDWFSNNIERLSHKNKDIKTLYCNWSNATNPQMRMSIFEKLEKNNIDYIWDSKDLKTAKNWQNSPFKSYGENMSNYKFVVSPPGNGIDVHRTWEALYMGCYPIVIKNFIYDQWSDLPIIQVKDYSEVTYDLLHSYLNKEYDMEKLYMTYWKNKIFSEFDKIMH